MEIAALLDWSNPKPVRTKNGPRQLSTAAPTNEFWSLWRSQKDDLRNAGLSVGQNRQSGEWEVCWWFIDTEKIAREETSITASKSHDAEIDVPAPSGLEYLPYQRAGIRFGLDHQNVLIGDEMGLGKTIQAIGIINSDETLRRILVICPASLKLNWKREITKWLTRDLQIEVASGTTWPETDIVICNYDIAAKNGEHLHGQEWDAVILDEAHYCKNPKAQRTQAILGKWDRDETKRKPALQARRKIALTGTPILNRPIEAQLILGYLDKEEFGNFFQFARRYADAHQTRFGWDMTGAINLEELQRRLRATVMVRRLKSDVLTELPPKRRQVIELPANGCSKEIKAEQTAYARHQERLDNLRIAVEVAKLLEDKEAYAEAIAALRAGQSEAFEEMAIVRHEVALAKVPYVVEHVANTEEPVVLFAHHRDVVAALVEALTDAGRRCVKVVGGMADADKQASVDAFQSGKADVFVGNIKAAGVGLTLTRSSHVVFAELDWVPANMSQAEDRTHRIGQHGNVLVQHLVLEGSLDQVMAEAIVRKQDIADKALDDPIARLEAQEPITTIKDRSVSTEPSERQFSEEAIRNLLSRLQYLAERCDGARNKDGMGFNGCDSAFGKALACQKTLTQRQAAVADRLLVKYAKQLEGLDVD